MDKNVENEKNERMSKECVASFEIEGIKVTPKMLEDGMKIIKGEITKDELVACYLELCKKK